MQAMTDERVEQLIDYIMKNCLWQFHSRAWDRRRQNEKILGMTTRLLQGETLAPESREDKCYWVDAVCLAEAYQKICPWISGLSKDEIGDLMAALHKRLDHLTIDASLNEELTDKLY